MIVKDDAVPVCGLGAGLVSNALELLVDRNSEGLVLRRHLEQFIACHVPSSLLVNDLVVIIDEALNNVFLHSYAVSDDDARALVRLHFQQMTRSLCKATVTITDYGQWGGMFNPFRSYVRNDENWGEPDAGLGIRLILRVMDEVGYEISTKGTNLLHMEKYYLNRDPDAAYSVRLGTYLVQQGILTDGELAEEMAQWERSPFADLGDWLLASGNHNILTGRMRQAIIQARHLAELFDGLPAGA